MGDDFLVKKTVETVFNELDLDGSGKVEFSEFLVASMQKEKIVSRDKIEKAFKLIDQVTNPSINSFFLFFQFCICLASKRVNEYRFHFTIEDIL